LGEKVLRRIEMEIADSSWQETLENGAMEKDDRTVPVTEESVWNTEHSDESSLINDILENPLASPAAPSLAVGAEREPRRRT
jgi:hypothetical protein